MQSFRLPTVRLLLQGIFLLAGAFVCTAVATAQEKPDDEQRRIREIRIYIADVYTDESAEESSWASSINRFHITTHESVIRTHLLFKEGEILDDELLKSSERGLRRFKFLNKVEVSEVPVDEHTVDVEVHVKDAWSIEPGIDVKGGGDLYTISAHLIEFNLLGYGKKVFAEAVHESDVGTTMNYGYSDYQLFNSRYTADLRYKTGPQVESFYARVKLPLYSPDSKWSYGFTVQTADRIRRLFEDGEESSRYGEDNDHIYAYTKRSFGERYKKLNLTL